MTTLTISSTEIGIYNMNELNDMFHEIVMRLNTLCNKNYKNMDFYQLPLIIIETVEEITKNRSVSSIEKLNLAKDTMEYCLTKLDITKTDKNYAHIMFPIMTESLISISNKKFKLYKKPTIEKTIDIIIKDIYDHIKDSTNHIEDFSNNFFKIILVMINKVNNYKNITNTEKKNIIIKILKCIIDNFYDFFPSYSENDINKIIFFNNFVSSYIDNVFKVYKNKSGLNTHKQFFKETSHPFFK